MSIKEIPSLEIEDEEKEINTKEKINNDIPQLINSEYNEDAFVQSNIYDIFLNENGSPLRINKGEIFCVDNETEINIKVNNNSKISNEINLISNCFNEFPNVFFIDELDSFIIKNTSYVNLSEVKEVPLEKIEQYKILPNTKMNVVNFKINFKKPGIFTFLILYKSKETNKFQLTEPFFILVNPIIDLGKDDNGDLNKITLSKIQLQSVLSKNLGKLSNFENYYKEVSLLKYNFIHFTSIQSLSSSDNLFSLKNQNEISDSFFEEKLSNEEKLNKFKENINLLREKYHIGSLINIILNQTSIESNWLYENPECGYTLENCPWLTVSYELDKLLVNYSNLFLNGKVSCESAPYINNENDLNLVIDDIKKTILRENFEEFFLIPIEDYISKFMDFYKKLEKEQSYSIKRTHLFNELEKKYNITTNEQGKLILNDATLYDLISLKCYNYGESRFGIKINIEFVSMLLLENFRDKKSNTYQNEFHFIQIVKRFINKINEDWIIKVNEMIKYALLNIKEFIRYEFIELKRTGLRRKLIDNYFHVIDPNDKKKIFLCNGFIMQSEDLNNPFPDFSEEGTWYLFKRKVIINNDTLKINYGKNFESCPKFLIEHMSKYLNDMSEIFNGLFIDNIISIPKFIIKYLINEARKKNENLIIMTQLPEMNSEIEANFTIECGINLFSKEMIWCTNTNEILLNISTFGKKNIEKYKSDINPNKNNSKTLISEKPLTLLFDLSIDNMSYYHHYNNLSLNLSMMACISLLDCAIGSSRGFDQLFPFQPSSIKENRNYIYDNNFEKLLENIKKRKFNEKEIKEIFFEFHPKNLNYENIKKVKLALSSHGWKPDIPLKKINNNLFTVRIKLPSGKYHYRYLLDDKIWTHDTSQPMEYDSNKKILNVLDLCPDMKILSNDLKLLRRDINSIRNYLKNMKTQVFIRSDKDIICIIRMIMDGKKIKKSIDSTSSLLSYDMGEKDYNRNFDIFYSMGQLSLNDNNNNIPKSIKPNIYFNNNNNNLNIFDNKIYEGYAVICRPGYEKNDESSINSKIILPGEISEFVCGCYMNVEDFEINNFLNEKFLNGVQGDVYYSKDSKFLSSISNVSLQNGNTVIDFHSILPNTVILLKLVTGKSNLNSFY